MAKEMSVKVLHVTKTTAQWASETTVISKGLLCVEFTTDGKTKIKVGDGVSTFANLPYVQDGTVNISNYYTKDEVDEAITESVSELGNVLNLKGVVATIDDLPTSGNSAGDLYFVGVDGDATDNFSEYIWTTNDKWEYVGRIQTEVDLSGYVTTTKLTETLSGYVTTSNLETALSQYATVDTVTQLSGKVDTNTSDIATLKTNVGTNTSDIATLKTTTGTNTTNISNLQTTVSGIETDISELETAVEALETDSHTHSNKSVLDATSASFTTTLESKLSGIEEGANKTVVDEALSTTSTNPVQNKAVNAAITTINNTLSTLSTDSHTHDNQAVLDATTASYTTDEKTKLSGIEAGANKTVVDTTLSTTSTNPVENKAVKSAIDSINESIELLDTDSHTHANASVLDATTASFTTEQETKLAGIAEGANKTVVDATRSTTSTNPVQNKVIDAALTALETDSHKHNNKDVLDATTASYTTTEKTKLAGIEEGATKTVVDESLSASSTNPVQNKAVNTALSGKVDKVDGMGLSSNDYTTAEKEKLASLENYDDSDLDARVAAIEADYIKSTDSLVLNCTL